jgi:hypothetical protein
MLMAIQLVIIRVPIILWSSFGDMHISHQNKKKNVNPLYARISQHKKDKDSDLSILIKSEIYCFDFTFCVFKARSQ